MGVYCTGCCRRSKFLPRAAVNALNTINTINTNTKSSSNSSTRVAD